MLRSRIIPILLLRDKSLVKTVKFNKFSYIGDPCNTVRIFNELEVDEISILDIDASLHNRDPKYDLIGDIASEAFMPLSYGGGINSLDKAKKIFDLGVEKVILNSAAINNPELISKIVGIYGSQAVVVSIDVKLSYLRNKYSIFSHSGKRRTKLDLLSWVQRCESLGAGEILLNSIDRDGTWEGYDLDLFNIIQKQINIPLIGCGGAKDIDNVAKLIKETRCSGAGVGSMVVFQKKDKGVLINFPNPKIIDKKLHLK
jgi:cyclase